MLLEAALRYAARGWPVFPLKPRGKTPITSNGFQAATTDPAKIAEWWAKHPNANVGVRTGREASVWVLDMDGPEGAASFAELETEIGALPDTLGQETGGGGYHLFWEWPEGIEVRNRTNARQGIDVRGEGGYVVAPPSIHPSGKGYEWHLGGRNTIAAAPQALLDLVCPPKRVLPPWERTAPVSRPPALEGTPTIERARLYLDQVPPAVQGSGGHNALLWATRALVVGFELDDATALNLLWSEFNPRCSPPWDHDNESHQKEFRHKVKQVHDTPGEKRRGWLLDDLGLRSGMEALGQVAQGQKSARLLLAGAPAEAPEATTDRRPFPVDLFPDRIARFVREVSRSHEVDMSFAAMPVLAVAAAAAGNVWRLRLKGEYDVPPTIWVCLVAPSGSNKSGPLRDIVGPLRAPLPMNMVGDALRNPQGEIVVGDATLEAVIARMQASPRGLLVFRDELAGWAQSFNAYKSSGGDEQAWLEFWDSGPYSVDRKTNAEKIRIPCAAACVLGGIQPSILAGLADPGRMASGLVPRILLACPPVRTSFWTEDVISPTASADWSSAISWLRTRPFLERGLDGVHVPYTVKLTPEAKSIFVTFHNSVGFEMEASKDDNSRSFMSKARVNCGRLALIHHALANACAGGHVSQLASAASMLAGVSWARWCLDEQLRVYKLGSGLFVKEACDYLVGAIRDRSEGATVTVREVQNLSRKRYPRASAAKAAMSRLVETGRARWVDGNKRKRITLEGAEE